MHKSMANTALALIYSTRLQLSEQIAYLAQHERTRSLFAHDLNHSLPVKMKCLVLQPTGLVTTTGFFQQLYLTLIVYESGTTGIGAPPPNPVKCNTVQHVSVKPGLEPDPTGLPPPPLGGLSPPVELNSEGRHKGE